MKNVPSVGCWSWESDFPLCIQLGSRWLKCAVLSQESDFVRFVALNDAKNTSVCACLPLCVAFSIISIAVCEDFKMNHKVCISMESFADCLSRIVLTSRSCTEKGVACLPACMISDVAGDKTQQLRSSINCLPWCIASSDIIMRWHPSQNFFWKVTGDGTRVSTTIWVPLKFVGMHWVCCRCKIDQTLWFQIAYLCGLKEVTKKEQECWRNLSFGRESWQILLEGGIPPFCAWMKLGIRVFFSNGCLVILPTIVVWVANSGAFLPLNLKLLKI